MASMAMCFPVSFVAGLLALFYGQTVRHAWLPGFITFAITMISGLFFGGVGQIGGVVVSALIIFLFFTRPEQKRLAQEQAAREQEAKNLPNEEDA